MLDISFSKMSDQYLVSDGSRWIANLVNSKGAFGNGLCIASDPISRGRRKLNVFYWNLWEIQAYLLFLIGITKSAPENTLFCRTTGEGHFCSHCLWCDHCILSDENWEIILSKNLLSNNNLSNLSPFGLCVSLFGEPESFCPPTPTCPRLDCWEVIRP